MIRKKLIPALLLAALGVVCTLPLSYPGTAQKIASSKKQSSFNYQDGDIIFQSSNSAHSRAIKLATNSKFSHVGVSFQISGKWQVIEAIEPVKVTPLKEFVNRGNGNHHVMRLKDNSKLTPEKVSNMIAYGLTLTGLHYDVAFNWDDSRFYCSELVWKIYDKKAGIEICQTNPLKTYDLSHPLVQSQLAVKYGKNIPYDEPMVSPQDLYDSDLLELVYKKGK